MHCLRKVKNMTPFLNSLFFSFSIFFLTCFSISHAHTYEHWMEDYTFSSNASSLYYSLNKTAEEEDLFEALNGTTKTVLMLPDKDKNSTLLLAPVNLTKEKVYSSFEYMNYFLGLIFFNTAWTLFKTNGPTNSKIVSYALSPTFLALSLIYWQET